jgi:hypothetical protein
MRAGVLLPANGVLAAETLRKKSEAAFLEGDSGED